MNTIIITFLFLAFCPCYSAKRSARVISYQISPKFEGHEAAGEIGPDGEWISLGVEKGNTSTAFITTVTPTTSQGTQNTTVAAEAAAAEVPNFAEANANCEGPPLPCNLAGRKDFNPALSTVLSGDRNQPGIRARLNAEAFSYLSRELVGILNYQIKRFQLPDISQCMPKAGGCLRASYLRMNRYQCTRDVFVNPAAPNRLVLDVRNLDLGVAGDLGGQLTLMVPLALFGQVHVFAQRISMRVGIYLDTSSGSPRIQLASCRGRIGNVDTFVENGGLLGDIANQNLRQKLNQVVRRQISSQICKRLPGMLDQQVNPKISGVVPSKVPLKSISQTAMKSSCLSALIDGEEQANSTEATSTTTTLATFIRRHKKSRIDSAPSKRQANSENATTTTSEAPSTEEATTASSSSTSSSATTTTASAGAKKKTSMSSLLMQLLDMNKLNNIFLSTRLSSSGATATSRDYTLGIGGGFSVCGWGCTPFGPFPVQIPACQGNCKMADILLSDYTINSLLYHLHRVGFFVFRLGPDTPVIGKLMRLTCLEGEDEEGSMFLEDHGVEDENGTVIMMSRRRRVKRQDDDDLVSTLISTGICIRSILPAAAEEYPEETVDVRIQTLRAPSVNILKNGTITMEGTARLDFTGHSNKKPLATYRANSVVQVDAIAEGNLIKANLSIPKLELTDIGQVKSGMDQDGLNTIAGLMQEKIPESINEKLQKGCKMDLPPGIGGMPLRVVDPEIHFLDHAVHIKSNFALLSGTDSNSPLGNSEPC